MNILQLWFSYLYYYFLWWFNEIQLLTDDSCYSKELHATEDKVLPKHYGEIQIYVKLLADK
jgi:hypothetical protein